jgi:hypothetical protein
VATASAAAATTATIVSISLGIHRRKSYNVLTAVFPATTMAATAAAAAAATVPITDADSLLAHEFPIA